MERLKGTDLSEWIKDRLALEVEVRQVNLEAHLKAGVPLSAELDRGELRFLIDGIPSITGIFPPPQQAPFILAQWKLIASRTEVNARMTGKNLAAKLKKVALRADDHLMADIIRLQEDIGKAETEIATLEAAIDKTIYRLHNLTQDEIEIIETSVNGR